MLVQPHLVVVVSSSAKQNLGRVLKKELLPSFAKLEAGTALRLVHVSASKVEAVEDAVTFAPALFKL